MQKMPPDEFENLLHPVFQEDEWILILLGGVLGALAEASRLFEKSFSKQPRLALHKSTSCRNESTEKKDAAQLLKASR